MRSLLFAAASVALIAFASPAAAQDEAPVDSAAAAEDECQRPAGRRGPLAQSRLCRGAYSVVRQCGYAVNVRAAALRYASGKRRHAHVARCV